jgi:hypothetical protein
MNWTVALVVAFLVVVLGGVAARLWWNLAHKAAPYGDERGGRRGGRREQDNVVVIKEDRD